MANEPNSLSLPAWRTELPVLAGRLVTLREPVAAGSRIARRSAVRCRRDAVRHGRCGHAVGGAADDRARVTRSRRGPCVHLCDHARLVARARGSPAGAPARPRIRSGRMGVHDCALVARQRRLHRGGAAGRIVHVRNGRRASPRGAGACCRTDAPTARCASSARCRKACCGDRCAAATNTTTRCCGRC